MNPRQVIYNITTDYATVEALVHQWLISNPEIRFERCELTAGSVLYRLALGAYNWETIDNPNDSSDRFTILKLADQTRIVFHCGQLKDWQIEMLVSIVLEVEAQFYNPDYETPTGKIPNGSSQKPPTPGLQKMARIVLRWKKAKAKGVTRTGFCYSEGIQSGTLGWYMSRPDVTKMVRELEEAEQKES
jgi:hypothetical protein